MEKLLKISLGFVILSFLTFKTYASNISVLSDLDDTLKVTNVQDRSEAIWNALFSSKAFKGMPGLMQEIGSYSNGLYVLTASPSFLNRGAFNRRIDAFFEKNRLQVQELFMRDILKQSDKRKYKLDVVRSVLEQIGDDSLILMGDDVEIDHEVYTQIRSEYPGRIAAIYIHKVTNRKLPEGVIGYYTAYDIALNEYKEKRMTFTQASSVGTRLLLARSLSKYLPDFVYCPKKESDFPKLGRNALTLITRQTRLKLMSFCR